MTALDVAHEYFDAWNRHDPDGIVATFAEGGTYTDPSTGEPLTGQAIGEYASGLMAGFPDLNFEIVSEGQTGDNSVAVQWIMKGTNSGSIMGIPPTEKTIALPGADFVTIEGDKITTVVGYFDQKAFVEQLGLQVDVHPTVMGRVSVGTAVYMNTGNRAKPGAFSITAIQSASDEDMDNIEASTEKIFRELIRMPGMIGSVTARIGGRGFTITAWEDTESLKRLTRGGAHKNAMGQFFAGNLGVGGMTSVWVPERMNSMWVRCIQCGQMADAELDAGKCQCGATLPDHPPYW